MNQHEILLVDDDTLVLDSISEALKRHGWRVTTADSGEVAVELLNKNRFKLVITDLVMGQLSGIDILKKTKELNPNTIVMILTGYADMKSAINALQLDADDYLIKSCTPEELVYRVQKGLDKFKKKERSRASEHNYRSLVETSLQGVMIFQDFRFVFANSGLAGMLGYTVDEILSFSPEDIKNMIHPEDRQASLQRVKDRMEGKDAPSHFEQRAICKDGSVRWTENFADRIEYSGRPAIIATFLDITDRKLAEKALKESEQKYRSIFRNVPTSIITLDKDGIIKDVNPYHIEHITKNKSVRDDYIGTSLLSHPSVVNTGHSALYQKVLHGEFLDVKDIYFSETTRGGEGYFNIRGVPLFADGEVTGAVLIHEDITELKHSKKVLHEGETLYKTLTEHIADGVTLVQEGKCLFANSSFAKMLGYTDLKELIEKDINEHISKEFKNSFLKLYEDLGKNSANEGVFQGKCIAKDGREFWVEARLNIIKWEGKPAVLSTTRDITKSKLKEIAIKEEADFLRNENIRLRASMKDRFKFGNIIGKSAVMQDVYELILKARASDAGVIIYGDSGTGKELVANAIHESKGKENSEFVPVNCGAIPEALLEREFFGHIKGAFTGAETDAQGYLDLADGGTLFLDEVGDLALHMQVKLLRAIDGKGYTPVGSNKVKQSDFRILAATNKDLKDMITKGLMREDFFYRIHVIPISLPPLKGRRGDIPLLIDHFLKAYDEVPQIPGKIMDALVNYDWPGNVRELQNVLHRYITLNELDFIEISQDKTLDSDDILDIENDIELQGLHNFVKNFEKNVILKTLSRHQWHKSKAASALKIDRKTLFTKMKSYGITRHNK
jgi:PAS domain S-box-containing protein